MLDGSITHRCPVWYRQEVLLTPSGFRRPMLNLFASNTEILRFSARNVRCSAITALDRLVPNIPSLQDSFF
jgi:hypothetical protein